MRPDRNPWVPSLLGAAILAMAALAPGGLAQNTSDPPAGGNETMAASSDGTADRLSYTDGHAEGRFVSFDLDPTTGTVCDWTYKGQLVLDEIHWGEFSADVRQTGAAVVVADTGASASGGSSPPGGASGGNGGSGGGGDGSPYQSMENSTGNQTGNGTDDGTGTGGNATGNETATPPGNETVAPTGACAGQPAAENETSTGGNGSESSRGASAPAGGSSRMLLHEIGRAHV